MCREDTKSQLEYSRSAYHTSITSFTTTAGLFPFRSNEWISINRNERVDTYVFVYSSSQQLIYSNSMQYYGLSLNLTNPLLNIECGRIHARARSQARTHCHLSRKCLKMKVTETNNQVMKKVGKWIRTNEWCRKRKREWKTQFNRLAFQ